MSIFLTLVSRRAPTMSDVRAAVAEARERTGLGQYELVGDFDDGDPMVELSAEVSAGELLMQIFRPTVSLSTAADRYTVELGFKAPLGEDGLCRLTQMGMSGTATDEQTRAVLAVVRHLALACEGYLVGEGEYAPLEGVPAPERSDQPPPKRAAPRPARAFVEAFLTRPIRGQAGWVESMNLLRDVLDGLPRLRPKFIQREEEWRPFRPVDPVPEWWPGSQYLLTPDPHVRWKIIPAFAGGDYYTNLSLAGDLDPDEVEQFVPKLIELAKADLDYGLVHAWHEDEPTGPSGLRLGGNGPWMLLTARDLTEYLPTLYWAQIFGPPWVELFGADTIATTPAYRVEEVAPDHWLVQLTEHLADMVTDHARFAAARAAAIDHLGADAFYDPDRGWRGPYRTPEIPALADRGLA